MQLSRDRAKTNKIWYNVSEFQDNMRPRIIKQSANGTRHFFHKIKKEIVKPDNILSPSGSQDDVNMGNLRDCHVQEY
jgi:hypothetical protein